MKVNFTAPFRHILTVSELTQEIKELLEEKFFDLWVEGEISNFRVPPSGHIYFTLKDDLSQIRAVIFRSQARALRFVPEDGLHVICRGRVSLYEKRGEYQIILGSMEPKGIGALQLASLQLKEKLEREGLFDSARKKPLPVLPQRIGIVTSPTGAVIRDMIQILQRRFENLTLLLYPVRVQGEGAAQEIAEGIDYFNREMSVDVLIVGRGGGSTEDLWAFNEEVVARAIFRSKIPLISAVGHETDFTIADFVADLRAPTPSAAAELVVKEKKEIKKALHHLTTGLENEMIQMLRELRQHLAHLQKRQPDPRRKMEDCLIRVDDLTNRVRFSFTWRLKRTRETYFHLHEKLCLRLPGQRIDYLKGWIAQLTKAATQNIKHVIEIRNQRLSGTWGRLDSLSPLSILQRGYSITRKLPSLEILKRTAQVRVGEKVSVRLHEGTLSCTVENKDGA